MNRQAKNRIETAISILISFSPLYGTVFFSVNKRQSELIPTMAVAPIRKVDIALMYNPDFVMSLTKQELIAVLKHEALHLLLHHLERVGRFSYNMRVFNIAADLAINTHIENLPEGALYPKDFGFENDKSADYYYAKLKKRAEDNGKTMDEEYGDTSPLDDHSNWGEFDKDIIEEKVRAIAERSIKEQEKKGWGSISGNLVSEIISANKPKLNWKKEVRYFVNKLIAIGRVSTRMRDNKRTRELYPFLNPGSKRRYTSKLLIAFDTSGSVSDSQLKMFLDEVNGMLDHVIVDTVTFDTKVYGKPKSFNKKSKKMEVIGRGGTDFNPPISLADELKYDGIIMFTDGYAPIPPKPKCRVMWCLTEDNNVNFSYGKRVFIPES